MTVPQLSGKLKDLIERNLVITFGEMLIALGDDAGGRTGGMFRIFLALNPKEGPKGWVRLYERQVGSQQEEVDWQKYEFISFEKFLRLAKNCALSGHTSAWTSRDPRSWEYGGAFVFENLSVPGLGGGVTLLVTFSGLPELADEALILRFMQRMYWGSVETYRQLYLCSQNSFAMRALKANGPTAPVQT